MFKFHSKIQNSAFVAKNLVPLKPNYLKKNLPYQYRRTKNLIPHKPYFYHKHCIDPYRAQKPHSGPTFFPITLPSLAIYPLNWLKTSSQFTNTFHFGHIKMFKFHSPVDSHTFFFLSCFM